MNCHNINYRKYAFKELNNSALKKLISVLVFLFSYINLTAQSFNLPDKDSLFTSIDNYFNALTDADTEAFQEINKGRLLNYLPSPGYSPFTGGFTLSVNLSAPLQELRLKRLSKQRIQAINKQYKLQAETLKNEVFADLKALEISIQDYHSKDTLVHLKEKAFKLAHIQYQRNQSTPTEFLAKQYDIEALHVQRINEANLIHKQILLLLIKAKKPMHSYAPAFISKF